MYYFLIFSLFFVSVTWALGDITSPTDKLPKASGTDNGVFIAGIIRYAIILTGILAVVAVTWSAIRMFLAYGDETKFKNARMSLVFALVGVAVSSLAYVIVSLVTSLNFS